MYLLRQLLSGNNGLFAQIAKGLKIGRTVKEQDDQEQKEFGWLRFTRWTYKVKLGSALDFYFTHEALVGGSINGSFIALCSSGLFLRFLFLYNVAELFPKFLVPLSELTIWLLIIPSVIFFCFLSYNKFHFVERQREILDHLKEDFEEYEKKHPRWEEK